MKFLNTSLFLILLIISLISPRHIFAHPIDEIGDIRTYDQKQTIEVGKDKTNLIIDLTFYPLDKIKIWESIDKNRDREISNEEKTEWMKKGQEASWLEINSQRFNLLANSLTFPSYYDFFSSKPADVRIDFLASRQGTINQNLIYHYQGKDKKLEEIEFVARGIEGLKVTNLVKIDSDSVSFTASPGLQSEGAILGLKTGSRLDEFLSKYVKANDIPLNLKIFALFVAFTLGALHALTPGHGKAIVAGYLVGSRGTPLHALNLGLIITITHTAVVFLLGFVALVLTEYFVPSQIIKPLTYLSGFLVFAFGLFLLFQRCRKLFRPHSHEHSHDHDHRKDLDISWKNLLPLGISGGIVPCIDALAILIVAISLQKILFGLVLLSAFSLGLATALVGAGLITVLAKETVTKRFGSLINLEPQLSVLSAIIVTILGFAMIIKL
ncbi:sulfite exporter TauE/SafE family protein [Candidatus Woesebacteria bacterium]|nr:sulfite exporter TauE/SafE family protein [Candidatus Woesebacteria bacterium]